MWYRRGISTAALLLWMLVIFSFSAAPAEQSSEVSTGFGQILCRIFVPDFEERSAEERQRMAESIDYPVRKTAHATEYAVLGGLCLCCGASWFAGKKRLPLLAYAFGTLYAAGDELHQLFVPGRSGQVGDVLLDSAGVCVGVLAVFLVRRRLWRRKGRGGHTIERDGTT